MPKERPEKLQHASDLDWQKIERIMQHYDQVIRELKAEIDALETRVEALENP